MSQITCCPSCGTQFRVVADQLRISDGWVRCGRCQQVFDANQNLQNLQGLSATGQHVHASAEPDTIAPTSSGALPTVPPSAPAKATVVAPPSVAQAPQIMQPVAPMEWPLSEEVPETKSQETQKAQEVHWDQKPPSSDVIHEQMIAPVPVLPELDHAPAEPASPLNDNAAAPSEPAFDMLKADSDPMLSTDAVPKESQWGQEPTLEPAETYSTDPVNATDPKAVAEPEMEIEPELAALQQALLMPKDGLPTAQPMPSFVRQAQRKAWWNQSWVRFGMGVLVMLLPLALLLQVALHERNALAARWPYWQPILQAMCVALRCEVAPYRNISAVVVSGSAFAQESQPHHYRLDLSIRNQAAFAVAMPAVELSLTDAQDQVLVRKVLQPQDIDAPQALAAHTEWSATVPLATEELNLQVQGYRVLLFYP